MQHVPHASAFFAHVALVTRGVGVFVGVEVITLGVGVFVGVEVGGLVGVGVEIVTVLLQQTPVLVQEEQAFEVVFGTAVPPALLQAAGDIQLYVVDVAARLRISCWSCSTLLMIINEEIATTAKTILGII